MIKNTLKRGFTLIELLVVIAIIGILASVVMASLNSARDKGEDAAVKASLSNARAQAALFYDNSTDKSYTGVCADLVQFGVDGNTCNDGADFWVAALGLTEGYYCVDASGAAVTVASGTVPTIVDEEKCSDLP